MKKYCMSCGNPTEYNLKTPNFCSNCGKSFSLANKEQIIKKQNLTNSNIIEKNINDDYYDDDEIVDIYHVPKISKIDIEENDLQEKTKGIKLGNLIGTSQSEKREKIKKAKKNISRKKILEDFANEAGSIRKKNK